MTNWHRPTKAAKVGLQTIGVKVSTQLAKVMGILTSFLDCQQEFDKRLFLQCLSATTQLDLQALAKSVK